MTPLPPLDVEPAVSDRIRRLAHRALADQLEPGSFAHLERVVARWVEPPLVAAFAAGLVVWSVRAVLAGPVG